MLIIGSLRLPETMSKKATAETNRPKKDQTRLGQIALRSVLKLLKTGLPTETLAEAGAGDGDRTRDVLLGKLAQD